MGYGCSIVCENGHEHTYYLGSGEGYPQVYEEVVAGIRQGDYGERLKSYFEENPGAAVNAGTSLYVCERCHHLHEEANLDLYQRKDGKQAEENWCYWCNDGEYEFVEHYAHVCPDCGQPLVLVDSGDEDESPDELPEAACSKCGAPVHRSLYMVLWD